MTRGAFPARLSVIGAAMLLACSSASNVDDAFQSVVGEFCSAETSTVTRQGNDARVVLRRNKTETREVTDAQGFVREQTVRSCQRIECIANGGATLTDAELIRTCESGL